MEDYRESSTRFLAEHGGWSGLVLGPSKPNTNRIARSPLAWRTPLDIGTAFVTAENVNTIIEGMGYAGDIAILVIDIDGNEYWVSDALSVVRPAIYAPPKDSSVAIRNRPTSGASS